MKYLIAIIFLLTVISASAQKNTKPNIIFIFADDLGYGDIGCYGQQKIETPNIDKLAQKGMKFTQFYSGSTVCAPSRSSFLTGLHTGHTAIRGNVSYPPEGQTPIPDSVITFANLVQQNGYATAAFGKSLQAVIRIKKVSIFFMVTIVKPLLITIIPIIYGTIMIG